MTLWIALIVVASLALAFHWMSWNRERPDLQRLRAVYWGDPSFHAISFDVITIVVIALICLRAAGIDVPALFEDF